VLEQRRAALAAPAEIVPDRRARHGTIDEELNGALDLSHAQTTVRFGEHKDDGISYRPERASAV
jgi:hypothetical protein